MFGFEFELLIPVTSDVVAGTTTEAAPPQRIMVDKSREQGQTPSPLVGTEDVGAADREPTFTAETDHSSILNHHKSVTWPSGENMTILEIVTSPMDAGALTSAQVRQRIERISLWAVDVHKRTVGGRMLADEFLVANPPKVNYIGPTVGHEHDRSLSPDAYIQQTYGLRLDKVRKEFADRANALKKAIGQGPAEAVSWFRPLQTAQAHATKALNVVGNPGNDRASEQLAGLFALVRYYVSMWSAPGVKTLGKNNVGLFYYKTKLSTVRNQLAANTADIKSVLDDQAGRTAVLTAMNVPDKHREWAEGVLAGTADKFFDATMNPYSNELHAPSLGPPGDSSVGVVVENRDFRHTDPVLDDQGRVRMTARYQPQSWPDIAEQLHARVLRLQGHG